MDDDLAFSQRQPGRRKYGEASKFLPVLFMIAIIICLYTVYVFYHCLPLLQTDRPAGERNAASVVAGWISLSVFHVLAAMLLLNYALCILVSPGTVPDTEEWEAEQDATAVGFGETKKNGKRRQCKWCHKIKPDRCHHCRVCKKCVLRMDHHCPWIYNCVGHGNYKYFFNLLFYAAASCHMVIWTMFDSVRASLELQKPMLEVSCLVFGETLAALVGLVATVFFIFHIWLLSRAMTTIEFCEKSLKNAHVPLSSDSSQYDLGLWSNICNSLGANPLLWCLPNEPSPGDGLHFPQRGDAPEEARLLPDACHC